MGYRIQRGGGEAVAQSRRLPLPMRWTERLTAEILGGGVNEVPCGVAGVIRQVGGGGIKTKRKK